MQGGRALPEHYSRHSTSTLEDQQRQIDRIEERLQEYREEVARAAVQLKNQVETAGGSEDYSEVFKKQASSARVSKWIWQIVAIFFFVILLLMSIALTVDVLNEGLLSKEVGTDLIVLTVILFIALFATRQSNKAREDELETRRTIMKLSGKE